MSKEITAAELAFLTHSLLMMPHVVGELDTPEKYQAFMTDLTSLICEHFGGDVCLPASMTDDGKSWVVGIKGNESLPDDGGVWKAFDPEGELFTSNPDAQVRSLVLSMATGTCVMMIGPYSSFQMIAMALQKYMGQMMKRSIC